MKSSEKALLLKLTGELISEILMHISISLVLSLHRVNLYQKFIENYYDKNSLIGDVHWIALEYKLLTHRMLNLDDICI